MEPRARRAPRGRPREAACVRGGWRTRRWPAPSEQRAKEQGRTATGLSGLAPVNRDRHLGVDRVSPQGSYWRSRMVWETPVVEEIAVGLEVTAYVSADEDELP